ncbi:MAG: hypothetical protein JXR94_24330 [Candidatus Hydrogenedentes bacterium]|nr:hypothetical protein [Candidatus Hydrogenedentota bacterium]
MENHVGNNAAVIESPGPGGAGDAHSLLLHKQLLGKRLHIQSVVRFFVAAGVAVTALGAKYVAGIDELDVPSLLLLALFLGLFNIGTFAATRRYRGVQQTAASYRVLQGIMHLTISVDFLFLTFGLWLVGGAKSPFKAFYLVHVILASILLSPRAAWLHALFGYGLLSGLVVAEWFAIIPARFPVGAVNSNTPLDGRFVLTVLVVQAFLMALTVFLVTSLARLLREGEQQLRTANTELGRLSNMHRDFFHIALHDLKSPVSAAVMLLHGLEAESEPALSERQSRWVSRLRVRLNELTGFLRDFEVMASLDAADLTAHRDEVDVGALLRRVAEDHEDLALTQGHRVEVDAPEDLPRLRATERLVYEAVANLASNAIKYTPDNGRIVLGARRSGAALRIEVIDNGIGIAPDDQKRLFHEFVRVRRRDLLPRKTSGSGLGLSIVRRIAKAHGGRVGVESELGKGSTFYIEFPLTPAAPAPPPGNQA